MSSADKLESCKIEIRSILLPYQKGCYLSDFNCAYRDLIGNRLPYKEMGFKTDIEFLYSMPDVVKITPCRGNQYHLMGIADDKSKHIQKMVAKQKPAKLKPPPFIRTSKPPRFYHLPPRFTETRNTQEPKFSQKTFPKEPEVPIVTLPPETKLPSKASPMEEVIALVKHFNDKLAIDDVICEYQRMYNKSLSLSLYGFSTITDCITVIPELEIVRHNNVDFVRSCSTTPVGTEDKNDIHESPTSKNDGHEVSSTDYFNGQNSDNKNIPTSLKEKLQKVAERFSDGILSSDFPTYYEEVTGCCLELGNLGYRCLNDLIDDVPDIFTRKPVTGSRKDCFIYSVKSITSEKSESMFYESSITRIVVNLRRILEAYPEGLKVCQVIHMYSINYQDSLNIKDFGFDDLEIFLSSIKKNVPLRFDTINGEKSIHLVKLSDKPADLLYTASEAYDKEAVPYDAVFPEFVYKPYAFPPDFDFSSFIPAYTSSVAHAGHLYIQLQNDTVQAEEFMKLAAELDDFYNGSQSEQYIMKQIHIKVEASCVAKWPEDNHWYRAQILSIPSMQNVQVFYVDYGTRDTIPKFLLRYAKKEFINLPIQAIRCRLAFLKPPKNATNWIVQTRNRILKLCEDVALMAKIEEKGPDGVYSVLLCDTNADEDVYINDLLINEGLADGDTEPEKNSFVVPESPVHINPLHNVNQSLQLQAFQAQYFLQAFAAVAPSFAQNENYLKLLRHVSAVCQSYNSVNQSINVPLAEPPGFSPIPQSINKFTNSSALYDVYPSTTPTIGTASLRKPKANVIPPPRDFFSPPHESISSALSSDILPEEREDGNNELFDDDDDEMFQQFCQKVSLVNIRYVKRIMLGDGYKIHIIVIESKPYASSGDISQLIWNNKEADYLLRRLQLKDVDIPVVSLSEDGNEELFQQLWKFNVKGVQKTTGFKSSIVLCPLTSVIKILNIFGHPSVTLRTKLTEEIASFNPNDQYWKDEISSDVVESEDEDSFAGVGFSSVTDDDKIEKLCLYDLMAMKESIKCKKQKMLSTTELHKSVDEIDKLEQLYQKVLSRIQEINEICKVFA